ncbi:MAG: hypothetical protein WAX69_16780 [Victivallales bacterium]
MKRLIVIVAAMGFAVVGCNQVANPTTPAAKVDDSTAKVADAAVKSAVAAKAAEITKTDTNKDGKVTVVEYMAIYKLDEATAKKADKNANGIIEVDEFVVVAPAAPAAKAPVAPAAPAAKK